MFACAYQASALPCTIRSNSFSTSNESRVQLEDIRYFPPHKTLKNSLTSVKWCLTGYGYPPVNASPKHIWSGVLFYESDTHKLNDSPLNPYPTAPKA